MTQSGRSYLEAMTLANPTITSINWKQAAGEALLIVLGVILALGGQAWWEARVERNTVGEYVDNLLLEVNENEANLRRLVKEHENYIKVATGLLHEMRKNQSIASTSSIREQISILFWYDDFRPATSALDDLVGSGGFRMLENSDLRLAVLKYAHSIDVHNSVQAEQVKFLLQSFIPYLSKTVPLLEFRYTREIPDLPTESVFEFDPMPLIDSMEFENLIVRRIGAESDAVEYANWLLDAIGLLQTALQSEK